MPADDRNIPNKIVDRERRFRGRKSHTIVEAYQTVDGEWRKRIRSEGIAFSDKKKAEFLSIYRHHNRMLEAAEIVGVSTKTVREHIKLDPEFGEAVVAAEQAYKEEFMSFFQDLCFNGTTKINYDRQGNVISEEQIYPVRLIELEAKRIEPGYRERQEHTINHTGGVLVAPSSLGSIEEWQEKFGSKTVDVSFEEVGPEKELLEVSKSEDEKSDNPST